MTLNCTPANRVSLGLMTGTLLCSAFLSGKGNTLQGSGPPTLNLKGMSWFKNGLWISLGSFYCLEDYQKQCSLRQTQKSRFGLTLEESPRGCC